MSTRAQIEDRAAVNSKNVVAPETVLRPTNSSIQTAGNLITPPAPPPPTCFRHPSLLRRQNDKSAEGMVIQFIALFGLFYSFKVSIYGFPIRVGSSTTLDSIICYNTKK